MKMKKKKRKKNGLCCNCFCYTRYFKPHKPNVKRSRRSRGASFPETGRTPPRPAFCGDDKTQEEEKEE